MMDNEIVWYQYKDYEKFYIRESKYGLFISCTESGEELITALTHDVCLRMTGFHQWTKSPEYDGSATVVSRSATVEGKL